MPLSIARLSATLFLLLLWAGLALGAASTSADEWTVTGVSGEVGVTTQQARLGAADIVPGLRLQAPFTVRTGSGGELAITRGEDSLGIGPDSLLDLPEAAGDGAGGPLTRIHQKLGSVLYQVRHRLEALFEVHTPYLVSVVKGTTFNVLATADSSTVALIEGRLLVRTPDERAEVFLEPGQAAIRSAGDEQITVEDQRRVSAPVAGPIRIADGRTAVPALDVAPVVSPDSPPLTSLRTPGGETRLAIDGASAVIAAIDTGAGLSVGEGALGLGGAHVAGSGTGLSVDVGESSVEIGGLAVGGTGLTPAIETGGVSVSVGGVSLDVGLEPGVEVGPTSVELGGVAIGGTGLTPAVQIGDASLDIGGISLGLGPDPGVELGETAIGLGGASVGGTGLTPALEVGDASLQIGGIGLGAGPAPDLDLGDTALALGGLTVGETALTPEIGLGETTLNVGGSGIGLGAEIDLGVIDPLAIDVEIGTTDVAGLPADLGQVVTDTATTVLDPVGQLIGGLKLF